MDKTYYTNRDAFYMTIEKAATFPTTNGQTGSICVGIDPATGTAELFFEQGADWTAFEDGERENPEWVEDWMPGAIQEAVDAAVVQSAGYTDDLEWYLDWADDADRTIKVKQFIKASISG